MDKLEYLRSKGVDVDTAVENMMGEDIYNDMIAEFLNALPEDMAKLEEAKNKVKDYYCIVMDYNKFRYEKQKKVKEKFTSI